MNIAYQLCLDATWQLEQQHGGAKGYISIAQKGKHWQESYYTPEQLPALINGVDVYNSQNTFWFPSRKTVNIKQLRSLFVDIDCYRMGLTTDQVLWQLEQDFFGSILPVPNLVILSGRGLVVVWHIKPAPAAALPLWQFAEDWTCKQLEYLGADTAATDAARVFRLAGTVNSKNGVTVQVLECHNHKLDLKDWQRDWLPTKKVQPVKTKTSVTGKITNLYSTYSLHYSRMQDIKILVAIRNGQCEGHREVILFLYRYYSLLYCKDTKEALEAVLELNKRFNNPLPWREAVHNTRSAEHVIDNGKKYNYSNKKLIKLLEIAPEEQRHLKTIICTDEKYRRNNEKREKARRQAGKSCRDEYLTQQEQVTQDRIQAIQALLKERPGIKQKEIAENLGITPARVCRLMAIIKN